MGDNENQDFASTEHGEATPEEAPESGVRPLNAGILSYASPESVCGHDDRKKVTDTQQSPYWWVCKLSLQFAQGSFVGSGWLLTRNVEGLKYTVVVTCGHCVYETSTSSFAKSVTVVPGANGSQAPYGAYTVMSDALRASDGWKAGQGKIHDYGAILLPYMPHLGGSGIWQASDSELDGLEVLNAGYPGDLQPYGFCWEDSGPISDVEPQFVQYMNDTYGGESGSPVLAQRGKGAWWTVGIHGYGGCPNGAVRLNSAVTADILKWATT